MEPMALLMVQQDSRIVQELKSYITLTNKLSSKYSYDMIKNMATTLNKSDLHTYLQELQQ